MAYEPQQATNPALLNAISSAISQTVQNSAEAAKLSETMRHNRRSEAQNDRQLDQADLELGMREKATDSAIRYRAALEEAQNVKTANEALALMRQLERGNRTKAAQRSANGEQLTDKDLSGTYDERIQKLTNLMRSLRGGGQSASVGGK